MMPSATSEPTALDKPIDEAGFDQLLRHYCNADKDWGPIPDHNFTEKVTKLVSFIRHGARVMCSGDQWSAEGRCWAGDEIEFDCRNGSAGAEKENAGAEVVVPEVAFSGQRFVELHRKDDITSSSRSSRRNSDMGRNKLQSLYNRNNWRGSCGLGEMTPDGYEMHRANGDRFFDAYPGVFQVQHLPGGEREKIAARSSRWFLRSDIDASLRTVRSAETLAGRILHRMQKDLPDPDEERTGAEKQKIKSGGDKNEAVAKVTLDDPFYSTMQPNSNVCPRMADLDREYWQAPERKKLQQHWDQTVRRLLQAELGGVDVVQGRNLTLDEHYSIFSVGDCVFSHLCPTVGAVPGTTKIPFTNSTLAKAFSYLPVYFGPNSDYPKQRVGPLIADVLDDLRESGKKNFFLYSGHDTGPLAPLLGALDVEDLEEEWRWPPFASYINFEFTSDGLARVVYAGRVLKTKLCKRKGTTGTTTGTKGQEKQQYEYVCDAAEFLRKLEQKLVPSEEECRQQPDGAGEGESKTGGVSKTEANSLVSSSPASAEESILE
eukprot:g17797.t1